MKKKYKLVRRLVTASVAGGLALRILVPPKIEAKEILYNEKEQIEINLFEEELTRLETEENITFHNKELFMLISNKVGGNLTSENIKNIKNLVIEEPINGDLSDLKYLTNLKFLIIKNNNVDAENLKYNQQLIGLKIENGTLYNSDQLPNSIQNLRLKDTELKDYTLILPYYLQELHLKSSPINNIEAKNNSSLRRLYINGEIYISASCLVPFENLNYIKLINCGNLKDSENLTYLPNLHFLSVDEYASIWLDKKLLNKLPIFPLTKMSIDKKIESLDKIALELKDDSLSQKEQITKIVEYIIDKYQYDNRVKDDSLKSTIITMIDNKFPISTSLNNEEVICINFASIFQAMALRLDIDSILLVNDIHAWNAYNIDGEYLTIDPTTLNTYYENRGLTFITPEWVEAHSYMPTSTSSLYEDSIYPLDYEYKKYNIGYLNKDSQDDIIKSVQDFLESIVYNKITFNIYSEPLECIVPCLIALEVFYIYKYIVANKKDDKTNKSKKLNKKIKNNN